MSWDDCASAHHADSGTGESQARDVAGVFTQGCQKWLPWVIAAVARTANYSAGKRGPLSAFALFTLGVLVGTRSTELEGHVGRLTPKTDDD